MDGLEQTRKNAPLQFAFDNVFCLTLRDEVKRQESVKNQLLNIGITEYEFLYGVKPNTTEFEKYKNEFQVIEFPPCFRCGLTKCNCENNYLTDEQIAVFFSYLKLWKKIASIETTLTLIVEDDVYFSHLSLTRRKSIIKFCRNFSENRKKPLLIRLGWARCKEHWSIANIRFHNDVIKMSNPCHAMNSEMAKLLLKKLNRIDTTSDIFLHSIVGPKVTNVTVSPPIACDQSWSFGNFQSLIHPKNNHIKQLQLKYYLFRFFNYNKSKELKKRIDVLRKNKLNHVKRIEQFEFCIVGHPRCGSGYTASLFKSFGCEIGHEETKLHGISSWMFVADDMNYPFALSPHARSRNYCRFNHFILHLRNLYTAVPSVCLENTVTKSYDFRRKHIIKEIGIDLESYENRVEKALVSICCWVLIAERLNPILRLKVEDCELVLQQFLYEQGYIKSGDSFCFPKNNVNSNKKFNSRNITKPEIQKKEWEVALNNQKVRQMVENYCIRYGYEIEKQYYHYCY